MKENAKSTRLGWKIWFSAIVFGLVGQIAWVVENMYFATFAQDIYTNSGNRDMAYVVTTLMASFQDYIPTGTEGRFQGVRMCFNVLLPMIIGPLITLIIGLSDVDTSVAGFTPPFKIFLAASIVAVLAFLPLYFVRKDSDRLRLTLSEKRENAAAEATQPEESAGITEN